MARIQTDKNRTLRLAATFGILVPAFISCATYEGATSLHTFGAEVEAGVAGDGSAGAGPAAGGGEPGAGGGSLTAANGGDGGSIGGASAGAANGSAGTGGSPSAGGSTAAGGNVGNGGGTATGGSGGSAGTGGTSGGSTGTGGTGSVVDQLLSQGKPASADSEETAKGNLAALGNDGSTTTRWCAADGAVGHHWQVDLGAAYTITKLEIDWEKAAIYKFKVEGSTDDSSWITLVDQTSSTTSAANQMYTVASAGTARYVRVTVTGLANSTTWASFYELMAYGH